MPNTLVVPYTVVVPTPMVNHGPSTLDITGTVEVPGPSAQGTATVGRKLPGAYTVVPVVFMILQVRQSA